jgi:omega-amidase
MQDLNISLIQCPLSWEDSHANLAWFSRKLEELQGRADIVLLPEMFSTGFSMSPERLAEEPGGPVWQWMRTQAMTLQMVVAGSMMVMVEGAYFNRFVWMEPDGSSAFYDKRHLFRMGDEPKHFSAGRDKTIITYRGWKILPLVCYDLRFPVWSRNRLTGPGDFEYDLILYTANWPSRRTRHWEALLKARAIENQAFVAGVNRTGYDGNGNNHDGHSLILDPLGDVLAEGGSASESILSATLVYRMLHEYRERFPVSLDWDRFSIEP